MSKSRLQFAPLGDYEEPPVLGHSTIKVLSELHGIEWNDRAKAYCMALRPSAIRVIDVGIGFCADWISWRLTVHVANGTILYISQEVEIPIPADLSSVSDLRESLGL